MLGAIDYLRISVTDRCNLRCNYCMPQHDIVNMCHDEILTFEEIRRIAGIFVLLGIRRIRLTGGEPLMRKGILNLIKSLSELSGLKDLCVTTNGTFLPFYAKRLKQSGVNKINISLDTLKKGRFIKITGYDALDRVLEGIDRALEEGFTQLKLNVVVMKGINDDEIIEFVEFAADKGMVLRFIEFMKITPLWEKELFMPIEDVVNICKKKFGLSKIDDLGPGPASYYMAGKKTKVGFIKTSENNCKKCTRLRLTSTGELKICLYETEALCLRGVLRGGANDKDIADAIRNSVKNKIGSNYRSWESQNIYMCKIGG